MAYSRWTDSDWYVYWDAGSSPPTLAMWHVDADPCGYATVDQLRGITEEALAQLVATAPRGAVSELLGFVREFVRDVDDGWVTCVIPQDQPLRLP